MNSAQNQAFQALMLRVESLRQEVQSLQSQQMDQPHFSPQPNPYNNWGCVQPTENMQNWNMGSPMGNPTPRPRMDLSVFMGVHQLKLPIQVPIANDFHEYKVYAIKITSDDEIPEECPGDGTTRFILEGPTRKTMLVFVRDHVLMHPDSHKEFKRRYFSKMENVASMILSPSISGGGHAGRPVPTITMAVNYGFGGMVALNTEVITSWLEQNREIVTPWLDAALTAANK